MEEQKKVEEVKKEVTEQPDATLPPKDEPKVEGQPAPDLNSNPVPVSEPATEGTPETAPEQTPAEPAAPIEPTPVKEENGATDRPIDELKFTQRDVDGLVGKTRVDTRKKTFDYIYNRYGVKDEAEMDALVGNAQKFDSLNEKYAKDTSSLKKENDEQKAQLQEVMEKVSLMSSGIDSARYEDAKLILKGKGMPVTEENIKKELETHPEWNKQEPIPPVEEPQPSEPKSSIEALGNEPDTNVEPNTEEDEAMKMFGFKR